MDSKESHSRVQGLESIYSGVIQQYARNHQQHHNTSLHSDVY
ncbi:hypothetical protein [Nostoc sp.]